MKAVANARAICLSFRLQPYESHMKSPAGSVYSDSSMPRVQHWPVPQIISRLIMCSCNASGLLNALSLLILPKALLSSGIVLWSNQMLTKPVYLRYWGFNHLFSSIYSAHVPVTHSPFLESFSTRPNVRSDCLGWKTFGSLAALSFVEVMQSYPSSHDSHLLTGGLVACAFAPQDHARSNHSIGHL